jgi:hypothetical protein
MVTIERLDAQGVDLEADGQGSLLMREPWTEGLLNLVARVRLKEGLRDRFPMVGMMGNPDHPLEVLLKGTLRRPLVSINGVPLRP